MVFNCPCYIIRSIHFWHLEISFNCSFSYTLIVKTSKSVSIQCFYYLFQPVKERELIQHFEIQYKRLYDLDEISTGKIHKILVRRQSRSYTITDLHSHAWYQICVKAYNGEIGSQCSNPLKVQTRESVPSDPPQNIIISKDGKTRVFIQWLPPPTESRNGDVKGYEVTVVFCFPDIFYLYSLCISP